MTVSAVNQQARFFEVAAFIGTEVITDPGSDLSDRAERLLRLLVRSTNEEAARLQAATDAARRAIAPQAALSILELAIMPRTYNALQRAGIHTVEDVRELADAGRLRSIPRVGEAAERDILAALDELEARR